MDVLYFEAILNFRQDPWVDFVIGAFTILACILMIFIAVKSFKEFKPLSYVSLFACLVFIAVPFLVSYIETNIAYVNCHYEVILEDQQIPEGYEKIRERGKITVIENYLTKPEYEKYKCEL